MRLFTSATVKFTFWFLCILMVISLLFSTIIFQVAREEISHRLKGLENGLESQTSFQPSDALQTIHSKQINEATASLILTLFYINIIILVGGGIVSYLLARRVLAPIETAHRVQSRFVSNASHQLRTPLAVMQAETELALDDPKLTKGQARTQLEENLEQVQRLSQLSSVLLRLSQSEQSLAASQRDDTVMMKHELQHLAHTFNAENRLEYPDDLPTITTSATIVREVLAILLDNAVKYSPKGSPITVSYQATRHMHQLTITNDGQPIKKEHLERIFEQFYRAHTTHADGYGLGLPLARQLATLLDGTLVAVPTSEERNIFVLSLPK